MQDGRVVFTPLTDTELAVVLILGWLGPNGCSNASGLCGFERLPNERSKRSKSG